jgi:hypothetical protein
MRILATACASLQRVARGSGPRRRATLPLAGANTMGAAIAIAVCVAALGCTARRSASTPQDDTTAATAESGAADSAGRSTSDTVLAPTDRAVTAAANVPSVPSAPAPPPRVLSPLADTIAQYLVFAPTVQTWFLAAKRGKRLLVDIGRVDTDVRHDHRRAAAFAEAVGARSPLPIGASLRLFHLWGQDTAAVSGFGDWNSRIVATIKLSPHLDSLVRAAPAAFAAVERVDSVPRPATGTDSSAARDTPARGDSVRHADSVRQADSARRADSVKVATRDSCAHDTLSTDLVARAAVVRDSIELWLRSQPPPPYDRLLATEKTQSSQVAGCFGGGNRLALAVDLRAGANEWVRERAVLLDTLGRVTTLRIDDYRFKGHDLLAVLDPNGAGIDGIVAKGVTEASGATVILALGPHNRAARWVSGFAWESR